jgi:hypothetical protein
VVPQVVAQDAGDEVVAVVVARVALQQQRVFEGGAGMLEIFRHPL